MSVAGMKPLLEMETVLIAELAKYGNSLKQKIDTIESFLSETRSKQAQWQKDREQYVSNPLNGFALIRRLHEDWSFMELFMKTPLGSSEQQTMNEVLEDAPTIDDMHDALTSMQRIQESYDLKASDMANGVLGGVQSQFQLNALDCWMIGSFWYAHNKYYQSSKWLEMAIEQFIITRDIEPYERIYDLNEALLYKNYARTLIKRGQSRTALNAIQKVADSNVDLWLLRRELEESDSVYDFESRYVKSPATIIEKGCRGQLPLNPKLKCHYQTSTNFFLKLAPFKVEMLSLDPYVAFYHDVIYDSEIAHFKALHPSSLRSADPFRQSGGNTDQTLKYAWVEDVNTLNVRIGDMTGLDVEHDTGLRVSNYGLGGHFGLKADNLPENEIEKALGDRLTTTTFFLTDVQQGGAIVIPHIPTSIFPKRGSSVVWHNLDNALNRQKGIEHVSCPHSINGYTDGPKCLKNPASNAITNEGKMLSNNV
ncbi:prolyl 4-hydroxylase subunit alpha-2-like [Scaptodrosophila lebanonensis]|uniref:Prolyl 4-hydroxylase subunit alpha-2-like n=1 Tax=Drosophila lebanonensis TaxID=7225 RepID=A0A6J2T9Z0_DROLE|nr:prolyl 4-hydroxylase subunit alpha-2-like [Scaptodrosophila lebanonensis]